MAVVPPATDVAVSASAVLRRAGIGKVCRAPSSTIARTLPAEGVLAPILVASTVNAQKSTEVGAPPWPSFLCSSLPVLASGEACADATVEVCPPSDAALVPLPPQPTPPSGGEDNETNGGGRRPLAVLHCFPSPHNHEVPRDGWPRGDSGLETTPNDAARSALTIESSCDSRADGAWCKAPPADMGACLAFGGSPPHGNVNRDWCETPQQVDMGGAINTLPCSGAADRDCWEAPPEVDTRPAYWSAATQVESPGRDTPPEFDALPALASNTSQNGSADRGWREAPSDVGAYLAVGGLPRKGCANRDWCKASPEVDTCPALGSSTCNGSADCDWKGPPEVDTRPAAWSAAQVVSPRVVDALASASSAPLLPAPPADWTGASATLEARRPTMPRSPITADHVAAAISRNERPRHAKGTPLAQLVPGAHVEEGLVTGVMSYGAFLNFGAERDGLLSSNAIWNSGHGPLIVGERVHDLRIAKVDVSRNRIALEFWEKPGRHTVESPHVVSGWISRDWNALEWAARAGAVNWRDLHWKSTGWAADDSKREMGTPECWHFFEWRRAEWTLADNSVKAPNDDWKVSDWTATERSLACQADWRSYPSAATPYAPADDGAGQDSHCETRGLRPKVSDRQPCNDGAASSSCELPVPIQSRTSSKYGPPPLSSLPTPPYSDITSNSELASPVTRNALATCSQAQRPFSQGDKNATLDEFPLELDDATARQETFPAGLTANSTAPNSLVAPRARVHRCGSHRRRWRLFRLIRRVRWHLRQRRLGGQLVSLSCAAALVAAVRRVTASSRSRAGSIKAAPVRAVRESASLGVVANPVIADVGRREIAPDESRQYPVGLLLAMRDLGPVQDDEGKEKGQEYHKVVRLAHMFRPSGDCQGRGGARSRYNAVPSPQSQTRHYFDVGHPPEKNEETANLLVRNSEPRGRWLDSLPLYVGLNLQHHTGYFWKVAMGFFARLAADFRGMDLESFAGSVAPSAADAADAAATRMERVVEAAGFRRPPILHMTTFYFGGDANGGPVRFGGQEAQNALELEGTTWSVRPSHLVYAEGALLAVTLEVVVGDGRILPTDPNSIMHSTLLVRPPFTAGRAQAVLRRALAAGLLDPCRSSSSPEEEGTIFMLPQAAAGCATGDLYVQRITNNVVPLEGCLESFWSRQ